MLPNGYGFSIWLVPYNWRQLKKEFNLDFIPHITLSTNHYAIPDVPDLHNVKAFNFKKGEIFRKIYQNDPLEGYGYYCELSGVFTNHTPHMTLFYGSKISDENMDFYSLIKTPPDILYCFATLADTTSLNPSTWKFL